LIGVGQREGGDADADVIAVEEDGAGYTPVVIMDEDGVGEETTPLLADGAEPED
jgi:hypothetical protein